MNFSYFSSSLWTMQAPQPATERDQSQNKHVPVVYATRMGVFISQFISVWTSQKIMDHFNMRLICHPNLEYAP